MSYELKLGLIIGVPILLIAIVLIIALTSKLKIKNKSKEYPDLLQAIGGNENISNIILNGSRVSMNFEDKNLINKDKIKENGVETIVMANKKLTLVIGKSADSVYKYLTEFTK